MVVWAINVVIWPPVLFLSGGIDLLMLGIVKQKKRRQSDNSDEGLEMVVWPIEVE